MIKGVILPSQPGSALNLSRKPFTIHLRWLLFKLSRRTEPVRAPKIAVWDVQKTCLDRRTIIGAHEVASWAHVILVRIYIDIRGHIDVHYIIMRVNHVHVTKHAC